MIFDPTAALHEVFQSHGVPSVLAGKSIVIDSSDLLFSADIVRVSDNPRGKTAQLDVRAQSGHLGKRLLIESFSGWGSDESEAAKHAFGKFLMGSMHVLLAALVDVKFGSHQVEWESWSFEGRSWTACLGPLLVLNSLPDGFQITKLLDGIEAKLLPLLGDGSHWLRIFFMKSGEGRITSEVLVDNLDWPEGRSIVDAIYWPSGVYSGRQFVMLMQH